MTRVRATVCGLIPLALALTGPEIAVSQESVFNLPAFGLPGSGESLRGRALGGAGLALEGDVFTLENPAQIQRFERAGVYLSLVGQTAEIEDRDESGKFDDVVFPMGQIVFPAWGETAVGVGYYQFVDFDAALESEILFEGDSIPVTLEAEGGVGVLAPQIAFRMGEKTRVGASLDIYLGSREIIRRAEVGDLSIGALAVADTITRDFRAVGVTVGVEQDVGRKLRLSAAYRFRPTLKSEITAAPLEVILGRDAEFTLPNELLFGFSGKLSDEVETAGVVRYSGWSGFERDGEPRDDFVDMIEIGGGVEYAPSSTTALLLGPRRPLRLGARWRRLPIEIQGETVGEWATSLGYSFGFAGRSRIDVLLEYGRRGDVDTHGLREKYLRFGVGLSVFEQWRRRREGS
jgi:hypothetical protein